MGWIIGQRVDYRWALNADTMRKYAAELIALAPDVILATSSPAVAALQEATRIGRFVMKRLSEGARTT